METRILLQQAHLIVIEKEKEEINGVLVAAQSSARIHYSSKSCSCRSMGLAESNITKDLSFKKNETKTVA